MPKQAPPADPPEAENPEAENSETPGPDAPPRPSSPPPPVNRFFLWVRSLGLVRQPGWIGGVSAGIADRLGIDVVIVRGILVVIAVLGGPAVLLYALAWLVLRGINDTVTLLREMINNRLRYNGTSRARAELFDAHVRP